MDLIINAKSGTDYDLAKLYLFMFPEQGATDKEISIRLSEDVFMALTQKARELSAMGVTRESLSDFERLSDIASQLHSAAMKLKGHKSKQSVIAEIKSIW